MVIRDNPMIKRYLDEVCSCIRAREVHEDIRRELESHFEELVLEQEAEGRGRDEAIHWAINRMGNPVEVGNNLHEVHRPRMQWRLLSGVLVLVVLGIFAMYAIKGEITAGHQVLSAHRFKLKIVSVCIGMVLMCVLCFFNYLKLRTYSSGLYVVTILGMIFTQMFGKQVNGSHYIWTSFLSIDWLGISPYLLMIAAPGMLMSWKDDKRFWLFTSITFLILPLILFLSFSTLSNLLLYVVGYLILLFFVTMRWRGIFIVHSITVGLVMLLWFLRNPYQMRRVTIFFNANRDPHGEGYMNLVLNSSIRSAGWGGHGIGNDLVNRLPGIPTDNILAFLIYSFGWGIGIFVILCLVYFIGCLIQSNRAVRDPYGRLLGAVMTGILSFQMIYSLLMPFGIVPLIGLPFPFLSYGGSYLLIEMVAVGLILSIYRRKDLARGY